MTTQDERERSLRRALDEPMPTDLRRQIEDLIEPHTMNMGIDHGDVMECIAVAYPVIAERERASALREMADEADMAIDDQMQPEYPGREVATWLRKRADRQQGRTS